MTRQGKPSQTHPGSTEAAPPYAGNLSAITGAPEPREQTVLALPVEIGSRRDLMADLTRVLAPGSHEQLLAILRLHGISTMSERDSPATRERLLNETHRLALSHVSLAGRLYLPRKDELAILFNTPIDEALQLLDQLTVTLNNVAQPDGITVEAGVALLPDEASDPISALERADRRIYPAQHAEEQRSNKRQSRRGEPQTDLAEIDLRLTG